VSGSAEYLTDYTLNSPPFQVVIPAGSTSATVQLTSINEQFIRVHKKTAFFTIQGPFKGHKTAKVTIKDH